MEVRIPPKTDELTALVSLIMEKVGLPPGRKLLVTHGEIAKGRMLGYVIIKTQQGIEVHKES